MSNANIVFNFQIHHIFGHTVYDNLGDDNIEAWLRSVIGEEASSNKIALFSNEATAAAVRQANSGQSVRTPIIGAGIFTGGERGLQEYTLPNGNSGFIGVNDNGSQVIYEVDTDPVSGGVIKLQKDIRFVGGQNGFAQDAIVTHSWRDFDTSGNALGAPEIDAKRSMNIPVAVQISVDWGYAVR